MIELSGTRRERLDRAIRLAYTEVNEAEQEHTTTSKNSSLGGQ